MPTSFFSRLDERARRTGSLLCVGLDPHPADLHEQSASAVKYFCLRLVEATADEKKAAARTAMLTSRFNTMFSIPMLYFMVAQSHFGIVFGG